MISVKPDAMRERLSDYLDSAANGETIVVSRESKPDVAVISLAQLRDYEKQIKNYQYLAEIERAFKELESGNHEHFHVHELIEE